MRKGLVIMMMACCSLGAVAQTAKHAVGATAKEDFKRNVNLCGDNYVAYQVTEAPKMTAAPKGYEVCYISHYGRHGSRYLIGEGVYRKPVEVLQEAEKAGQLTERGVALLRQLEKVRDASAKRDEELTLLGAQQHQGIAQRMYERTPELFKEGDTIDAKSSTVIRCILSMSNELMELKAKSPKMVVRSDASKHDMYYIIQDDKELSRQRMPKGSEAEKQWVKFRDEHFDPTRFLNSIFKSEEYWKEAVKNKYDFVVNHVWKIVADMQSTELRHSISLYDYFTEDELYGIWAGRNAQWYINYSASPLNGGVEIYQQRNLIRNIMAEADSCLAAQERGSRWTASLRFGHEVVVLPTACFMNLNGYGSQYADLNDLEANQWYAYRIFPMGSNIQMLFYRAKGKAVLVKFLLNEKEATVPELTATNGFYYKWDDVKRLWREKLERYGK